MGSYDDKYYIEQCKKEIEKALGIGDSSNWKQRDYEYLCDKIYDKTNTTISLSTIKRIWNVEYKNVPQPATLNALAVFAGFEDWNAYKKSPGISEDTSKLEIHLPTIKRYSLKNYLFFLMTGLIIVVVGYLVFKLMRKNHHRENLDKVVFSLKTSDTVFPNGVVFYYDVTPISPEKVTIQQTWDTKMTVEADPKEHFRTCIYFYPQFYTVKLFADGKLVKETPLFLGTKNWMPLVVYQFWDSIPVYIHNTDFSMTNKVYLSPEDLKKDKVDIDKDYYVLYYLIKDFNKLPSNSFTVQASIKNSTSEGAKLCQKSSLEVFCEGGRIIIPLVSKGCISTINLHCGEKDINGRDHDLSAFGCDMDQWHHIKVISQSQILSIFLDEELIYTLSYERKMGNVVGLNFAFNGCGTFKDVSLQRSNGEVVYKYPG